MASGTFGLMSVSSEIKLLFSALPYLPPAIQASSAGQECDHPGGVPSFPVTVGASDENEASSTSVPPIDASSVETQASTTSIHGLIDELIETKGRRWTRKTGDQHRLCGRILAMVAGTTDLAKITQVHIGQYRLNLDRLPQTYGKSPSDRNTSLSAILARSAKLKETGRAGEVGLSAPTINRHLTQLGSILSYASDNGWSIGSTSPKMRVRDDRDERDLCNAFSVDEIKLLLHHSVWTGSRDEKHRSITGTKIYHDALYFAVILAAYTGARVSEIVGLEVADVDFSQNAIHIRPNSSRRLKTRCSERDIPLHPEIVRLGFLDYVALIKTTNSCLVFPELRARGVKQRAKLTSKSGKTASKTDHP